MKLQHLSLLVLTLGLTACAGPAGTYKVYWDSISTAFSTPSDADISMQAVRASPYGLLMVKPGENPRAVMALAYLEHGQHKWISADDAMLITEQGRIVRTLGFANDVLFTQAQHADPLTLLPPEQLNGAKWQRQLDFAHNQLHGIVVTSVFSAAGEQSIEILQQAFSTRLVTEQVTFSNTNDSLTNSYWFDKTTGKLLRSHQQLAPFLPVFELTFLSNTL